MCETDKIDNTVLPRYNEKRFLLPDSENSMACYHAKIKPDGEYRFTIHDCITSIRLRGSAETALGLREGIDKLRALIYVTLPVVLSVFALIPFGNTDVTVTCLPP